MQAAAEEVVSLWTSSLRYQYFESHRVLAAGESAVLEFVTQMEPRGLYVTGRVAIDGQP